jgi:hypothetical protein
MKKITIILFMLSAFVISSCESTEEESFDEQTEDNNGDITNTGTGSSGTGSGSSIYNGSSSTGNYWSRNDGMGTASLSLSGTTAKACADGKETIGSFNSSKPSMTFTIGKDVLEFPLLFSSGKLYVGAPGQFVDTHNAQTQYVSDSKYACGSGSGGSTTSAKGTIMVWSDVPQYGFKYGFNVINVSISSVADTGTVSGGAYTSEPSCGATYCFTKEVEPGSYTVTGKIYPLQPISGPKPPNYTVTYTVNVVSNKCTKVLMR